VRQKWGRETQIKGKSPVVLRFPIALRDSNPSPLARKGFRVTAANYDFGLPLLLVSYILRMR
jgi:hypothetical protein